MTAAGAMETGASLRRAPWRWHLPRALDDGSPRVVVHLAGRIVNAQALAGTLGIESPPRCEELVRAAYERWGIECLGRLRGPFALAIVDPHRERTFVARDHLGLQPVFYVERGERVHVSSSPVALVEEEGVSTALNRVALADAICRRYPDPTETFFEAVRRVPGGTFIEIDRRAIRSRRYWNPLEEQQPSATGFDEAFELFSDLQRQAVARCLTPELTAVALSGGLDSTSVAAVAADLSHDAKPIALSMSFPGAPCDEETVQAAVATELGLPQLILGFEEAVGDTPLLDQALALNAQLPSPLLNYWRPPYAELARRGMALGARTILTGEGGDEWMAPSAYAAADLISQGRLRLLRRFLRAWNRSEDGRGLLWHRGWRPLLGRLAARAAGSAWDRRRARRVLQADPPWVATDPSLRRQQAARASAALGEAMPPRGFAAREIESSLTCAAGQQVLEETHALGESLGVAYVHPYYDVDLVAFFAALPLEISIASGWLRGLTRRQLATRFPRLGFDRQRKIVPGAYHRETLLRGWRETRAALRFPTLHSLGVLDSDAASRFVQDDDNVRRGWELLNVEIWARVNISR